MTQELKKVFKPAYHRYIAIEGMFSAVQSGGSSEAAAAAHLLSDKKVRVTQAFAISVVFLIQCGPRMHRKSWNNDNSKRRTSSSFATSVRLPLNFSRHKSMTTCLLSTKHQQVW